ncbi:ParB N-terminal domain-containing protein [Mammaliicoccus sciuri]|uniref:ParB N-terminal domain-containing protein n=1 Tax=Mammaliicoccus sciuri TaxID=1296 RepID=UPI001D0D0E95|nr:ParB N-terminal domain-containing protein [Mammaliicoccus sciuri]MCC2087907.1 ParB N-terminal domain-containing protein [Mammaliicoccus sciuri]
MTKDIKDLSIVTMQLKDLKPANYNPRVALTESDPEYQRIKSSIEQFGYVDPIIWNEQTNNIVGGHQRYTVLTNMGVEQVAVSVVNMNEEDEKVLNIALNKIEGDWDDERLKEVLETISDDKLQLTGFDEDEIEALFDDLDIDSLFTENEDEKANEKDNEDSQLDIAIELLGMAQAKMVDKIDTYKNSELYKSIEYFLEDK